MMKKYYNTNKEGTFVKVEVTYNKGGETAYTRERNPRGYLLYVSIVEREEKEGYFTETFSPYDSMRVLINKVTRASKKAEANANWYAETFGKAWAINLAGQHELQIIE